MKITTWENIQLQEAIVKAIDNKAPMKFTLIEILKEVSEINKSEEAKKLEYLDSIYKKDEEGNPIKKIDEPKSIFDYEILAKEEDVKDKINSLSMTSHNLNIPEVPKDTPILVNLLEGTKEMGLYDYFNAQADDDVEKFHIGSLFFTLFWRDAA